MKTLAIMILALMLNGCNKEDLIAFLENNSTAETQQVIEQNQTAPQIYQDINETVGLIQDFGNYAVYASDIANWDSMELTATNTQGIIKITYTKIYERVDYGNAAIYKFDNEKKLLEKNKEITFIDEEDDCIGGKFTCDPENYTYSMYVDKRIKVAYFTQFNSEIKLSVDNDGYSNLKVTLEIEAPEFAIVSN